MRTVAPWRQSKVRQELRIKLSRGFAIPREERPLCQPQAPYPFQGSKCATLMETLPVAKSNGERGFHRLLPLRVMCQPHFIDQLTSAFGCRKLPFSQGRSLLCTGPQSSVTICFLGRLQSKHTQSHFAGIGFVAPSRPQAASRAASCTHTPPPLYTANLRHESSRVACTLGGRVGVCWAGRRAANGHGAATETIGEVSHGTD